MSEVEPVDRRVARTRRLLSQALLELVREKEYALITVQEVLDRADVGRSTFYAHFRNKDDLLLGDLRFLKGLFDDEGPGLLPPMLPLFQHVSEFSATLRKLFAGGARPMMFERLRVGLVQRWIERVERLQREGHVDPALPASLVAQVATAALLTTFTWWLDQTTEVSPHEIDTHLRKLLESY